MATTREQAVEAIQMQAARDSGRDGRDFLREEDRRIEQLMLSAAGLVFDFSKHDISGPAFAELIALTDAVELDLAIQALARGDALNTTEGRAAQHMALRGSGKDEARKAQAKQELERALTFAEDVRRGVFTSSTDEAFTHILHIGIGGSDLGPRLVYETLSDPNSPVEVRFLSSVDPDAFERATAGLDPATTLVFIVSKSFGTPETTLNTQSAIDWLEAGLEGGIGRHLVAATSKSEAARDVGISDARIFEMWDWVGGRYSLWSCVAMSVMVAIGRTKFEKLLGGAQRMDEHFLQARASANAPVMSALVIWWHRSIKSCQSWAVAPYAIRLRLFSGWLKQLSMESLGKSVTIDGKPLDEPAGSVIFGGEGPDSQHAFFQMLHQGVDAIPVDIIAFADGGNDRHRMALLANAIAQAEALLVGRSEDDAMVELSSKGMNDVEARQLAPHMVMAGGRGSTFILGHLLDAESLGALLAFYEHQTFVLSVLFGVNAFDQFGVELGKKLACTLENEWSAGQDGEHDASTRALIRQFDQYRR